MSEAVMQELHTQSASVPETPHEVHYDEDADRQLITQSYRNAAFF
jgi:hypothetical protein